MSALRERFSIALEAVLSRLQELPQEIKVELT